jgi:hypothetical protein
MSTQILKGTVVSDLMCRSNVYSGCVKKKYIELEARVSTDRVKDAVMYKVYLPSFSI